MTRVSVVILNFNGSKHLQDFLPSVIRHSGDAEIVVIDNGSTDTSLELLSTDFPQVKRIPLEQNYGFTGGYNRGLQQVDGKYWILLNSDVEVTPGWIEPIIDMMEDDSQIAAAQPKILSLREPAYFEYAGAAGGFIDYLGYPFCRGRLFTTIEPDEGQYDDVTPVFWASGACLFIRSDVFREMGGFDEQYFAHMEEIDLCWRIQRSGRRIHYNGHSTVFHLGGGTLHQSNPRKTYLNFRNSLITLYRNTEPGVVWPRVVARLILDLVASVKFLLADSWKDSLAVLEADIHFLVHLGRYRKARRALFSGPGTTPSIGIFRNSLVGQYYLKGRKLFRELEA